MWIKCNGVWKEAPSPTCVRLAPKAHPLNPAPSLPTSCALGTWMQPHVYTAEGGGGPGSAAGSPPSLAPGPPGPSATSSLDSPLLAPADRSSAKLLARRASQSPSLERIVSCGLLSREPVQRVV